MYQVETAFMSSGKKYLIPDCRTK